MLEALSEELQKGPIRRIPPAALVYKATWPEEKVVRCTVGTLAQAGRGAPNLENCSGAGGGFPGPQLPASLLYHPGFSTEYRRGDGSAEADRP